jgi:outer membrane protein assembly factor BamB
MAALPGSRRADGISINHDVLYCLGHDGSDSQARTRIWALDRNDGSLRWKSEEFPGIGEITIVGDGIVYAIIGRRLRALSTTDGTRLWDYSLSIDAFKAPAVTRTGLYVQDGQTLLKLDSATGEAFWRWRESLTDTYIGHPAASGDTV